MTKVYHYTHSEKVLREKPRTVKPEQNIGMSNALYLLHRHAYNEDIRKLKRFPAFGFSKDHEGVDLVEGKDFEFNRGADVLIAVPIEKPKFYAVEYSGFWNIQSSPYYEPGNNVLNAEDVGAEQAKETAALIVNLLNKHNKE